MKKVIQQINQLVFWPPFILLLLALLVSLIQKDVFLQKITSANSWILTRFDWLFSYTSFAMVILCVVIYFSPLGKVKIGGKDAVPMLNRWRWFSIILCTTIAVGILFWGVSEPLYHISSPPNSVNGTAAFAMSSVYMHWSITPYAIYTLPALLFALGYYNYNRKYSLGAMLFSIKKLDGNSWMIKVLDALCLFALAAGMSAVLGVGMLSLAGSMQNSMDPTQKPLILGIIGIAIVGTFTVSAASGLLKGIRVLSGVNVTIFLMICAVVFAVGPTSFILSNALEGLEAYAVNFIPHSLSFGTFGDGDWMHAWTTFYWANWMAWAPITALFLGRISYGYTVRQFILYNWWIPAGFGILWMSIFSGTSLYFELHEGAGLVQELQKHGPDVIIYHIFDYLPFGRGLTIIFLIAVFLSYVTAADSNTEAMSSISTKDMSQQSTGAPTFIKYLWGIVVGLVAWVMVSYAGVDGVKMLSNLGGLPALLLMVVLCFVGVKYLISEGIKRL